MTMLRGSVNEFDINLLGHPCSGTGEDRFSKYNWSLPGSHNTSLDKNEIFVDFSVMGESSEWGDVLFNGISLAHGVVGGTRNGSSSDSVDFLVEFSSGMVTELTTSSDRPLDGRWMPGSDTTDLTNTSMGASLQSFNSESLDNTLSTFTSGNSNSIDTFRIGEDFRDFDFLLEFLVSEVNLISDRATVELDLHNMSLQLSNVDFLNLSGADHTDGSAVLLHALKISLDGFWVSVSSLKAVNVVFEGVLLGSVVVLVETSLHTSVNLLSPDSGEGAEASWSLDVSDHTNDLHWWAFNNGGGVDNILLDDLLTFTSLLVFDTVSHTGLVAHESGEMDWLGFVVLWPVSYATTVVLSSSLWQVSERALSWVLELSVRHSAI